MSAGCNTEYVPLSEQPYERAAIWRGDEWRHSRADAAAAQRSIAISLKRIADMMEEDRKPHIEMALPDGVEDAGVKHRRLLLESLEAERLILERIASAIETRSATDAKRRGPKGESAVGEAETPKQGRP